MTSAATTGRDGAGARVAIVDSGVDSAHPWLREASVEHYQAVGAGERFEIAPGKPGDASGHGTACAGIIHRLVPRAALISVRVLGADGRGSRWALLAALRHCIRQRYSVVNLSVGLDVPRQAALGPLDQRTVLELYELADAAYTAGVVCVASGPNAASLRTYPGRFKSLIGVGRATLDDPEVMLSDLTGDHELLAPGTDVVAPSLDGGERRWTGTSFATPHVAAHVARVLSADPRASVERVKAALHAVARRRPDSAA